MYQPGHRILKLKNTSGGDYFIRGMLWRVTLESDDQRKMNRTTLSIR